MNRTDRTIEWLKNNRILSIIAVAALIIAGLASTLKNVDQIVNYFGFNKADSTIKKPSKDTIYPTIPNSEVEGIVTSLLKEKPQFFGYQNIFGQNYIASFTESDKRFILFRELKGLWEQVQTIDSLYDAATISSYDEWEFTTIDSMPCIFYTIHSFGNAFGSIAFNLVSFRRDFSYKIYSLDIGGSYASENDEGVFDNSEYEIYRNDLAKTGDNFSDYLEKKFSELNPVADVKKEDLDLTNPKNAVKAWEVQNASWLKQIEVEDDTTQNDLTDVQVKFQYYKDLTKYVDEVEEPEENENFILYDIFKYACIIKDKKKGHYFVAFAHDNMNVGGIKLQNDDLYVPDEWFLNRPMLINLKSGRLKLLPKIENKF
jgi:hypothetical protein